MKARPIALMEEGTMMRNMIIVSLNIGLPIKESFSGKEIITGYANSLQQALCSSESLDLRTMEL